MINLYMEEFHDTVEYILNTWGQFMGLSFGHLALLLVVVLVVFGAGKLPNVMRDLAKGIRAFKDGMNENETKNKDDDQTA